MREICPRCDAKIRRYATEAGDTILVDSLPSVHGWIRVVSLPHGIVRVEDDRSPGLYAEHSCLGTASDSATVDHERT